MQEGYQNTKFFHSIITQRRKDNHIHLLLDERGQEFTDHTHIVDCIVRYYTSLLGTVATRDPTESIVFDEGPKLDTSTHSLLDSPVTAMKIKAALWSIGDNKVPGPNGFNAFFL